MWIVSGRCKGYFVIQSIKELNEFVVRENWNFRKRHISILNISIFINRSGDPKENAVIKRHF